MKKRIILSILCAVTLSSFSQTIFDKKENTPNHNKKSNLETKKKVDVPVQEKKANSTIDFESKVVDYGTIEHKSDGVRKFVFKNNGTEPLIIKNAKGSCGCTVPTWPKEPIFPGATAEIGVEYATTRVGKFTKTITLTTNASKKPVILTIKGVVNPPAKQETAPERKTEGSPIEKK